MPPNRRCGQDGMASIQSHERGGPGQPGQGRPTVFMGLPKAAASTSAFCPETPGLGGRTSLRQRIPPGARHISRRVPLRPSPGIRILSRPKGRAPHGQEPASTPLQGPGKNHHALPHNQGGRLGCPQASFRPGSRALSPRASLLRPFCVSSPVEIPYFLALRTTED